MILEEKLWNQYYIDFPIENKLSILIGQNGSGKTTILKILKNHFIDKGEDVLFFGYERLFNLKKQDVINCVVTQSLMENNIFKKYNVNIDLLDYSKDYICCGYKQLVNFFCNIFLLNKETIVIIDCPENNLQMEYKENIINDILLMDNVKKLIIATHSPEIVSNNTQFLCCVDDLKKIEMRDIV